jgi:molybdenum cofactor biosynthesis enzyme MoaA
VAASSTAPLSVIVQVTKRCDFDCTFCSETLQMKDPTLDQLEVS